MKNQKLTYIMKIAILVGLILTTSYFCYKVAAHSPLFKDDEVAEEEPRVVEEPVIVIPKLNVIDEESNTRPVAIMIDNNRAALPHTGLQDAHIIYEIIVEGGLTRLLAVFKDKDTAVIGPVRSARHYFIDYALENDAVFVHFGHSPKTLPDISALKANSINGIYFETPFWRDKKLFAPHNVFTSIEVLNNGIETKKYSAVTSKENLLNYSIEEVYLNEREDALLANLVKVPYSSSHYSNYEYDGADGVYKRFMNGKPHEDRETEEQYTFKNIIVCNVKNVLLVDVEKKGRQDLLNVGSGEGYYFTNGYAIPIMWEKSSRTEQTIYKDINGIEIDINDGNTFIQIQPVTQKVVIE